MAKLDFFRRPVLIGNTARRTQNATIRGSVRRRDADGVSATPYVPGITGGTLSVKIEGTTYVTAAFASDDYTAAIATINAAIGGHGAGIANGEAFDTDGVITIRSTSVSGGGAPLGATGSVEITGGSAAAALGFNLTFHTLKAYGGEFASAPEGRVGNPFRTAFPTHSENLTTDSVNRAMSLLSTNLDMLYADNNREDTMLMKVAAFTNNSTYITLPAGVSVPIGLGQLSGTSTKEDLAPFFQIVDATTKQPHASRVVAVVKGTPGAAYPTGWPYANQTLWADNLGRNLLGQAVDKMAAGVAITAITEGKYVTCPGASFLSTVSVEDFVSISAATNFNSSDNNGLKWVVEEIVSNTVLALRPMSQGELFLVGTTPTSVQPQMDLAGDIGVGQSFGTLMVRTGAYATVPVGQPASLNLVVSPAIPATASVELWMASPMCWMDSGPYDMQTSAGQMLKTLASDLDPQPNGILAAPAVAIIGGGAAASVGAFYVRWHGRVIHVPSQTFTAPANPYSLSVVYWEEASNSLKSYLLSTTIGVFNPTTIFNGPAAGDPSVSPSGAFGFPVALVSGAAGVVTSVGSIAKVIRAGETCALTVGHGGQFQTLGEAANYLLTMSKANSETAAATGVFSHVEIILLSSQTLTAQVSFSQPDVVIRGASPAVEVTVNFAGSDDVFQNTLGGIRLQDVVVNCPGAPSTLISDLGTFGKCELRNVRSGTGVPMAAAARSQNAGVDVIITDCNLNLCGQVATGPAARDISISRSILTYTANAFTTTPQIIGSTLFTRLFIDKSSFPGWKNKNTGVLFEETGSTLFVAVRDSYFDFGAQDAAATSWFCTASNAKTVFSNCFINMPGSWGINAGTGSRTTFDNCDITFNAFGAFGLQVAEFTNNKVTLSVDTLANPNNSVITGIGGILVSGNKFFGVQPSYWVNAPAGSRISDNSFTPSASAFVSSSALILAGAHCSITGNTCTSTVTMTSGIVTGGVGVEMIGNYLDLSVNTVQGFYCNDSNLTVSGNYIKANKAFNLAAGATNFLLTGNQLLGTAGNAFVYGTGTFTNNYFTGVLSLGTSNVLVTFNDCIFQNSVTIDGVGYIHASNCTFRATGTSITGPQVGLGEPVGRKALISGCTFFGITTLIDCIVDGCAFDMGAVAAIASGALFLTGCVVDGCNFIATTVNKDIVVVRNTTISSCRSNAVIQDDAVVVSDFNNFFNTYCYANVGGTVWQGIAISGRTKKLYVDGCDMGQISGGTPDASVSGSYVQDLRLNNCGRLSINNCNIGNRSPGLLSTTSPRFEFGFGPWDPTNSPGSILTGTLTLDGTTTVTGAGTKFLEEIQIGDLLRPTTGTDTNLIKVTAIASDTSLTLASIPAAPYVGTCTAGAISAFIANNNVYTKTSTNYFEMGDGAGAVLNVTGNTFNTDVTVNTYTTYGSVAGSYNFSGNAIKGKLAFQASTPGPSTANMMITGNTLKAVSMDYTGTLPAMGVTLFTGVISGNTITGDGVQGAVHVGFATGIVVSGNNISNSGSESVWFFRCTDIILDGNFIYRSDPIAGNRVVLLNDALRWRITNNIIKKAWLNGTTDTEFGTGLGTLDWGFIMGNHFSLIGAAPYGAGPTWAPVGTNYTFLYDTALAITPITKIGGTLSSTTT